MGFRVDACRVEIEAAVEFEGRVTIPFEIPPMLTIDELPRAATLAESLLAWNDARLVALARAAGEATGLL